MIEVPTVLLLGAGASRDYGYPTGPELRDRILKGLDDPDSMMHKQLESVGYDGDRARTFRLAFGRHQLPTIDQFLEEHPEFGPIGTVAIACALFPDEEIGRLERRPQMKWYDYLWDELRQDIKKFDDNELTIVTFNYDRSLEQYLGGALEVAGVEDVGERLSSLGFIHVYGTLGGIPYIDEGARKYGDTGDSLIVPAANAINIIDRKDDKELLKQFELAEKALSEAKTIIILGFGYDATNVDRLDLREILIRGRAVRCLGTAWRIPAIRRNEIQRWIRGLNLVDGNCLDMFHDHFGFK